MDLRLVGILLLVPLLDVLLLVAVAGSIGVVPTVALVVLTALLGMLFVRAEGRHTIRRIHRRVAAGEVPTDELLDGGLLLIAGALLLTPGLVTDAIGFLLAVPATRYPIRELLRRYVVVPYVDARMDGFATGAVWTSGFPNADAAGGDAAGGNGSAGSAGFGGGTRSADRDATDGPDDSVVDVDFEEVDDEDGEDTERER